ncbi:hypothetical protein TcYC6_0108880 [Trypanosoma cruzi]|nr:hypothetical protein TcYC6_0108880 [Trypanosoma cruzi]
MERLHVQEELVLDAFRDVFYRAYSHFLSGDAAPFELRVPPHVVSVLTEGCVADLMWVLKLRAVPCAGGESGGGGGGRDGVHDPAAPPDASDAAGRHCGELDQGALCFSLGGAEAGCHCRRRAIVRAVRWCCCGAGGAAGRGRPGRGLSDGSRCNWSLWRHRGPL